MAQQQEKLDENARRVLTSIETDLVTLTNAASAHINDQMVTSRNEMMTELDEYFREKSEQLRNTFSHHQSANRWHVNTWFAMGVFVFGLIIGIMLVFLLMLH